MKTTIPFASAFTCFRPGRYLLLTILSLFAAARCLGQAAATLEVHDTRSVSESPSHFWRGGRLDFKIRDVIGAPGEDHYAANLTIAPWGDYSGGRIYQLNFNGGGIFLRSSTLDRTVWQEWRQLLLARTDGGLQLQGELEAPHLKVTAGAEILGGLHLWDKEGVPDNTINSHHGDRSYDLIGTYPGWDQEAVYIAGYNNYNLNWMHTRRVRVGQKAVFNLEDGSLGLNTDNTAGYHLAVNGKVRAKEVRVESGWADFVFEPGYRLRPLPEVERHIREHGRLPEVPSAEEVRENGVDLGKTDALLLQKIEEITLYQLELLKRIEELEKQAKRRKR